MPCSTSEWVACASASATTTASPACRNTVRPIPSTFPASSLTAGTVPSSTSTTRLDFSSSTPISVQVLYWVSRKNTSSSPIRDVVRWAPPGRLAAGC